MRRRKREQSGYIAGLCFVLMFIIILTVALWDALGKVGLIASKFLLH